MSDSRCRICGGPVPGDARYCDDCDFQQARSGRSQHEQTKASPARDSRAERGSLSMFLLVFLVASVGTIGMGITATPGISFQGVKATLGLGAEALESSRIVSGELRTVHTRVRIRADRTTNSDIVGMLEEGDAVLADHLKDDWYAVFHPDAASREAEDALGYVYAPLLKPLAPADARTASVVARDRS